MAKTVKVTEMVKSNTRADLVLKIFKYTTLLIGAVIIMFPFYWMINISFLTNQEIISAGQKGLPMLPTNWQWNNYSDAWNQGASVSGGFFAAFKASVIVSFGSTFIKLFFAMFAAYSFARFDFKFKEPLFTLLLVTMMLPGQALLAGQFQVLVNVFDWQNTMQGLIMPWVASVFTIFMLRNAYEGIPKSVYKAAEVDGCGKIKFFWKIATPMIMPTVITSALLSIIGSWNAYLWPSLAASLPELRTLPVWLLNVVYDPSVLGSQNMQMAGATMTLIPMILLFLIFKRKIMAGVSRSGTKG